MNRALSCYIVTRVYDIQRDPFDQTRIIFENLFILHNLNFVAKPLFQNKLQIYNSFTFSNDNFAFYLYFVPNQTDYNCKSHDENRREL